EDQQHAPPVLRVELLLQVRQHLDALLQELLCVLRVRSFRRPIAELEPLAISDSVGLRQCPKLSMHSSPIGLFPSSRLLFFSSSLLLVLPLMSAKQSMPEPRP